MTHLALFLGVLLISFSAIFVRLAGVSPDTAAFFRALYALPPLLALWLAFGSRRRPRRANVLAFASGLVFGFELALWHRSIQWIGAGLSTVLANMQVIFVGLVAWLLYGEKPRRTVFAGVALALAGMALVSGLGQSDAYGANPPLGALYGLAAAIAYATFLLLLRRSSEGESTPFGAFFLSTLGAATTLGAVGAVGGNLDVTWSWPAHGWLIALALGSQVIGWLCITYSLPRLPAIETSTLLLSQPMATTLWGYLIFGEQLALVQWAGVLLVMTGVALPTLAGARAARQSPATP